MIVFGTGDEPMPPEAESIASLSGTGVGALVAARERRMRGGRRARRPRSIALATRAREALRPGAVKCGRRRRAWPR